MQLSCRFRASRNCTHDVVMSASKLKLLAALTKRRDVVGTPTPSIIQHSTSTTTSSSVPSSTPKSNSAAPAVSSSDAKTKPSQSSTSKAAVREESKATSTPKTPAVAKLAASSSTTASTSGMTSLQKEMASKLQGAQFRWLNEQLYTTTSKSAFEMMQADPSRFEAYHEGFRTQVEKWPVNPVNVFIDYLKSKPASWVVGDFGCGDAMIAQSVTNKVHSFDLVSVNKYVTACDVRKVPLPNGVLDVAIFSLSLMGTNFLDFLREAYRTLKTG